MKPAIPFTTITIKHEWPANNNYVEQSFTLCIDVDPGLNAAYFWAQQFWFHGGDGGYFGIQSNGNINNTRQKIAIFSIWKSLSAEKSPVVNSSAEPFDHEGSGFSCKIPFAWEEGRSYKLTIRKILSTTIILPEQWEALVADTKSGDKYSIGNIIVPVEWGNLQQYSHFFIEYFRPINSCEELPYAKATYSCPVMIDSVEVNSVHHISKVEGPCKETGAIEMMEEEFIMETGKA